MPYRPPTGDRAVKVVFTHSGVDGLAQRSLSDQRCTICGALIAQGSLYTRHALPLTGTVSIFCVECRPFDVFALPPLTDAPDPDALLG